MGLYLTAWVFGLVAAVALAYRVERCRDRRTTRVDLGDTQEFDPVADAFEDYQQSISELLDAGPARRDELIQGLEAATAV